MLHNKQVKTEFVMVESDPKLDEITKLIDQTTAQAWALYRKLGGVYDGGIWAQAADMERLGQLGKTLRKLSDARSALGFATDRYSNGLQDL